MGDKREETWTAVKAAWDRRHWHALTPERFEELFYSSAIADEAIALMRTSAVARMDLVRVAREMSIQTLGDPDVRRVWAATHDDADDLFLSLRSGETPAIRSNFASSVVGSLLAVKGRHWVRNKLTHWWVSADLLEEEQDAIIRKMIEEGIVDIATYQRLGEQAARLAEAELIRSGIGIVGSVGASLVVRRSRALGTRSEIVAGRVESLVTHVVLPIDIRDACIEAEEVSRIAAATNGVGHQLSLIARALARAVRRRPDPMFFQLNEMLSRAVAATPRTVVEGPPASWSLPLLRLLHLQQVLEAPTLARVVLEPEIVLVPDVALYLMGRDAVSYTPELRVHRGAGSRWRARWAESVAEALACAFLEDSVQLDLATLSRIPESRNGPTPDFMAKSVGGEAFVFEVKGGTAWNSHIKQRREAIKQLAKDSRRRSTKWAGDGRAFACSLYAAQQEDPRSSLLHVDDPDFMFGALFSEEGELESARRHYVGVLESALLLDLADEVARRRPAEPRARQRESHMFEVPERDRFDARSRFVGSYMPLDEWARRLRHPEPDVLEKLRLFIGVEESVLQRLAQGDLPTRRRGASDVQAAERERLGSHIGVLSGESGNGYSRGVYSVLSDGAFLAVEFV